MKRKELYLLSFIAIFILIMIMPSLLTKANSNNENYNNSNILGISMNNYIEITLTGEISKPKHVMKIPKGKSYGDILNYASNILNEYSDRSGDLKKRYYESCEIKIPSLDENCYSFENTKDKININQAGLDDLIKLYGIGNARAQKIINYRLTTKIKSFDELKKIIGVSNEVITKIKKQAIL